MKETLVVCQLSLPVCSDRWSLSSLKTCGMLTTSLLKVTGSSPVLSGTWTSSVGRSDRADLPPPFLARVYCVGCIHFCQDTWISHARCRCNLFSTDSFCETRNEYMEQLLVVQLFLIQKSVFERKVQGRCKPLEHVWSCHHGWVPSPDSDLLPPGICRKVQKETAGGQESERVRLKLEVIVEVSHLR